jgi:hypothetical protein
MTGDTNMTNQQHTTAAESLELNSDFTTLLAKPIAERRENPRSNWDPTSTENKTSATKQAERYTELFATVGTTLTFIFPKASKEIGELVNNFVSDPEIANEGFSVTFLMPIPGTRAKLRLHIAALSKEEVIKRSLAFVDRIPANAHFPDFKSRAEVKSYIRNL